MDFPHSRSSFQAIRSCANEQGTQASAVQECLRELLGDPIRAFPVGVLDDSTFTPPLLPRMLTYPRTV